MDLWVSKAAGWIQVLLVVTCVFLPPVRPLPGEPLRGREDNEALTNSPAYHSHNHYNHRLLPQQHHNHNISRCVNGYLQEDYTCSCHPCWDGLTCDTYVDNYAPRFLVHAATAVLPTNATGVVYRAWSTDEDLGLTCPLGPGESARCPCASVSYQLFAAPGDRHFTLDPVSGILSRSNDTHLRPGESYTYKLMVQGTSMAGQRQPLLYDLLDLRIYVSSDYVKKIPWT
ncbi:hypothetical protein O3P69_005002 [Scylla paramamosain]|uniref:EGF-like domain-containing protein n=1 Tax=Scylla paramamosain TaxID=85552 RepID=A0AAW0U9H1_SCYPA